MPVMYVDKDTYKANKIRAHFDQKAKQQQGSNHPINRVVSSLASRLNAELHKKQIRRTMQHMKYVGCTRPQLKKHLEGQFTQDMTWDNYGDSEVDHDIGICNWDLSDEEQLKDCFNFSNLKPLWRRDNQTKQKYVACKGLKSQRLFLHERMTPSLLLSLSLLQACLSAFFGAYLSL